MIKRCYGVIVLNDELTGFDFKIMGDGKWTVKSKDFTINHDEAKNETIVSYNLMAGGRAPTKEELTAASLRVVELSKEIDYSMKRTVSKP